MIPVPPLDTFNLPVSTIAPVVALVGEKPVVPALNEVTPVLVNVTAPDEALTLTPVPPTADVTPVLVTVMAPVLELTLIPVDAVRLVTPVLEIVIAPEVLATLMPVPDVNVAKVNPLPLPIRI